MKELFVIESTLFSNILSKDFKVKEINSLLSYDSSSTFEKRDVLLIEDGIEIYRNGVHMFPNIKIIGQPCRVDKGMQYKIMQELEITTPETFFSINHSNEFTFLRLLLDIPNEETLVYKMANGARGLGQMLITREKLHQSFYNHKLFDELVEPTPKKKFGEGPIDEELIEEDRKEERKKENKRHLKNSFPRNFIIQKFVNKKREFRLLYFFGCEKQILIERIILEGNWQANASVTGEVKSVPKSTLPDYVYDWAEKLIKKLNVPWLSIDVYEDENGNFGVFEFQQEFAFQFVKEKKLLCENICSSISALLAL